MAEQAPAATEAPAERANDDLHCITQDPREPEDPAFLAACDDNPVHVSCSIHCPPECGGHPICDPCYRLALETGLVKEARRG